MSKAKSRLTARQRRFVAEYLIDCNGTQAAIRAGYSAPSAHAIAYELLRCEPVALAIEKAMAARGQRLQLNADWVLRQLHDGFSANLADIHDEHDNLLPVRKWPRAWQWLVTGIETELAAGAKGRGKAAIRKVRTIDRVRLLELIGKHTDVGAFRDLVGLGGDANAPPIREEAQVTVYIPDNGRERG